MKFNRLFSILIIVIAGITSAYAQSPEQLPAQQAEEVSDKEIEQFADAFREIQVIDQQIQQEMINKVQEEGVDVQRFNDYLNARQNQGQEIDASEKELEQFAEAYQEIEKIQEKALQEMEQVITQNDLTTDRYQEIAMAIQANPDLLEKLQQHFEP